MAKTIGKIAGIIAGVALIATGIGAALGGTMVLSIAGATVAASTIASVASAVAMGASLLAGRPKMPSNSQENANRLRATIDPRTFRKTAVGTTALATDIRDEEYTDDQAYLHRFIVCASHKVHSIDEIWFDDKQAWTLAGGVQGEFVGYLTVDAVPLGNTAFNISARMGDTRKYTGLANVHLRYKLTGNTKKTDSPFAQTITPRVTIRGRGALFYDPRLDSTVAGGSGSHRADDQTTWAWNADACNNPALALLFYLLGWRINGELAVGKGIPKARIDLASFAAAANICDETVTAAGGGSEPRYRCAGVWSEGDNPTTVIDMLKACMNADLDDVDGKLRLTIFTDDTFTADADFTADDVLGAFEWTPIVPLDQSFNIIGGAYTDPSDTSLYQQVDYPRVEATSPDGIDRIETLNLPMVQSPGQAHRLAELRLKRQEFGGSFTAEFQATAWRAQKNSIVRLTFPPLGFVNKTFRVAEMELRVDGVVPMVLREEDPDLYVTAPPVLPAPPVDNVVHDPTLDPIIDAIDSAGAGSATVFLFQRTATTTPPSVPSGTTTYTFATGVLTGIDNGWTRSMPTSGGEYRWMTTAVAAGSGATDTIATGEWATPAILAQDGTDGSSGTLDARLSADTITLPVDILNAVTSYAAATGSFLLSDAAGVDQSNAFTLTTGSNPQGLTMSYLASPPRYSVTGGFDISEADARVEIIATGSGAHAGEVYKRTLTLTKNQIQLANFVANGNELNYLVPDTPTITAQPYVFRTAQNGAVDLAWTWQFIHNATLTHKNNVDWAEVVVRRRTTGIAWSGPGTDPTYETEAEIQIGLTPGTDMGGSQFFIKDGAPELFYSVAVRVGRSVVPNGTYPDGKVYSAWAKSTTPLQASVAANVTANINGDPVANITAGVVRALAAIDGSNNIAPNKVYTSAIAAQQVEKRVYNTYSTYLSLTEQPLGDVSAITFPGSAITMVGTKLEVDVIIPVRLIKTNPVLGTDYSVTVQPYLHSVSLGGPPSTAPASTVYETWQRASASGTYYLTQVWVPAKWVFTSLTPGGVYHVGFRVTVPASNAVECNGTKLIYSREPLATS